jgi:plastocyanin
LLVFINLESLIYKNSVIMRISTIAALCTAPLALASSLDLDLRSGKFAAERGNVLTAVEIKDDPISNDNSEITSIKSSTVSGSDTVEEVILIWVNAGGGAGTSTVNSAAAATAAQATATHTVTVGGTEKVYTPDTIEANVGDVVVFQFAQENHTVTQSQFAKPCIKNGTFDSGFMANPNATIDPFPQAAMMVMVSTPLWFYCRQKVPESHCGLGMTFSINPTAAKTQADFQAAAIAQNGTGAVSGIVGGSSVASSAASTVSVSTSTATAASTESSSSSSSSGGSGLTTAQGTTDSSGSCTCAVICAAGSIPNPAAQGINGFGGMGSK